MDEDRGQIFPVHQKEFGNLILELLIEIRSDQMAYHKLYAEQLAGKLQSDSVAIQNKMIAAKGNARKYLTEALYAEYGDIFPEIKDLLKP